MTNYCGYENKEFEEPVNCELNRRLKELKKSSNKGEE